MFSSQYSCDEDESVGLNWDGLSLTAKLKIFNGWTIILIVANCLHVIVACQLIGDFNQLVK